MDADVAVVGLGAMGSMTAWHLARTGATVLGFEQYGLAHDRGAAGGESRLFRMAYQEGPHYVPLLRDARDLWQELTAASGMPLYTKTGCLTVGRRDSEGIGDILASAAEYDVACELIDAEAMAARHPQHRLDDGEIGLLDPEGAVLRPELSVLAAVDQARGYGAKVLDRTRVERVDIDDDRVRIVAGGVEYSCGRVVLSAGPWTHQVLPTLRPHLGVHPIVLGWFVPRGPSEAVAFQPDRCPAFVRYFDTRYVFGTPTMDQVSVKIGLGSDGTSVAEPDEIDRDPDESHWAPLADVITSYLPGLHPGPVRRGVYFDGYSPDGHGLVGRVPGADRAVVLAGFSGHGFKLSPAFGRVAAELALDGGSGLDVEPLAPARFLS